MKLILLIAALSIIVVSNHSCSDANGSKPASVEKEDIDKELAELGFVNVQSVKTKNLKNDKSRFYSETGLQFMSDDEVSALLRKTGFVGRHNNLYMGDMPDSTKKEIVYNYKKAKQAKIYYYDDFFREYYQVGTSRDEPSKDPLNRSGIEIIAPEEMFLPSPPNKDPMAIVKVDGGYLVLAQW